MRTNEHRDGWQEDAAGRDPFVSEALSELDPASRDPMYWFRFHRGVMRSAARELGRRRMMAQLTVEDVLTSWSRTLIPAAAVAAALAAFLLVQGPESLTTVAEVPVGIEELLVEGLEGTPIPAVLGGATASDGTVTFTSDAY